MMKRSLNFTDNHIQKKLNRKSKVITDVNICTIDETNKHKKNVKMVERNVKIRY